MINSISSLNQNSELRSSNTIKAIPSSSYGGVSKYDFLKLITAQLKYQDPLSPVTNFDFMGQAAQFNILEQIMELNQSFQTLTQLYDLTYTNSFLGKNIEWLDSSGELKSGLVEKLVRADGLVWLYVDGNMVAPSWVTSIKQSETITENNNSE